MSHNSSPDAGENLHLQVPAKIDVLIQVDISNTKGAFSVGTFTIGSDVEVPPQCFLDREAVICVLKGQGRAIIGESSVVLIPGTTIRLPRATFMGFTNTGTGILRVMWCITPGGVEEYFRELSRLAKTDGRKSVDKIATNYGIKWFFGSIKKSAKRSGKRIHTTADNKRTKEGTPDKNTSSVKEKVKITKPIKQVKQAQNLSSTRKTSARSVGFKRAKGKSTNRKSSNKGKEVYMGGSWVKVSDKGPVIATKRGKRVLPRSKDKRNS